MAQDAQNDTSTEQLSRQAALRVLVLSDGRPGHYHLAQGVAAAIRRLVEVADLPLFDLRRRKLAPNRVLAALLRRPLARPSQVLRLGYGLRAGSIPACDLVISAGGDTIAASVALARARGVPNIFCGTLRHAVPADFALIVSSYARHQGLPNHLVALKPNGIDPDRLNRAQDLGRLGPDRPPRRIALLIGGDSGLFHYQAGEWERLLRFLPALTTATGARWLVSTSRRTDHKVADRFAALARDGDTIEEFLDYRSAGPGTLPRLFANADMALCTEDSSTMISEAVCARLPVIGVAPRAHAFKPEEGQYRKLMLDSGWCRFIPLAELAPASFLAVLAEITPLAANHLDLLARELQMRLPQLFAGRERAVPVPARTAVTS